MELCKISLQVLDPRVVFVTLGPSGVDALSGSRVEDQCIFLTLKHVCAMVQPLGNLFPRA